MVFYSNSNNNNFIVIQAWNIKLKVWGIRYIKIYALKETQRVLVLNFFEFEFFCKSLTNFEKYNLKIKKNWNFVFIISFNMLGAYPKLRILKVNIVNLCKNGVGKQGY